MARMGSKNSHSRNLRANLSAIVYEVAADASGGVTIKNGAQARTIVGVKALATATSASGDVDVANETGAVATVAMATDGAIAEATALTNYTLNAYETLTLTTNGANDRGVVVIETVEA